MIAPCRHGGSVPLGIGTLPPVLTVGRGGQVHLGANIRSTAPRAPIRVVEQLDLGLLGAERRHFEEFRNLLIIVHLTIFGQDDVVIGTARERG